MLLFILASLGGALTIVSPLDFAESLWHGAQLAFSTV